MSNRVAPTGAGSPIVQTPGSSLPGDRPTGGFAAALRRAGPPQPQAVDLPDVQLALRDAARSLSRGRRLVDGVIRAARRGRVFSQEELIALQAGVYRYAQEMELAGKLVDKATGAVRQTIQSQQ